jgi:hypothetical protein
LANNYRFHPEANTEFKDSVKWHESNRKNSGKEFAELILERIEEITQKPESRSADEDGIRLAL